MLWEVTVTNYTFSNQTKTVIKTVKAAVTKQASKPWLRTTTIRQKTSPKIVWCIWRPFKISPPKGKMRGLGHGSAARQISTPSGVTVAEISDLTGAAAPDSS